MCIILCTSQLHESVSHHCLCFGYYEFEVQTWGYMKVGWLDAAAPPHTNLGADEYGFAFDGAVLCADL